METINPQGSKTQHLECLREQAKELYGTAFGPHKAANHEDLARRWRTVSNEISSLESSFVLYQGHEIEATLVNYLSGNIPTSTVDHDGEEELFRDEAGRYYLRRMLNRLDSQGEDLPASGRTHVHRININAAILWATTRLNSDTLDLRNDAANLLMEGRGYSDPHPSHLSADQRALLSTAVSEGGSAPSTQYGVSPSILEAATRYAATAGRTLEEMVAEFVENAANMAPGGETVAPEPAADAQIVGGCHRFTFDYPPTRRACGRQRIVEVTDEQMARANELAAVFQLTPSQFLRGLADHNDLPGQPRRANNKLGGLLQAENIAFVCMDETMAKRIERAAQARNQTADEFVAHALGGDVDMWEEAMLLHPATGELLEADHEELYTEVDYTYTALPVGCEHEPQSQGAGRITVRLDAETSAEVFRYLKESTYEFKPGDIVNGCVSHALEMAFAAIENADNHAKSSRDRVFADDAWGYVEEDIFNTRQQRLGLPMTWEKEEVTQTEGEPA